MQHDRRQSLWFTALSIAASALNFLFYPVLAHQLSLAAFGDVQVGVSFIMQAAALFTSLNLVALFLSANESLSLKLITRLERIIISVSILAAIVVALFAHTLGHILQLHDPSLLYILAVVFIINVPAGTWIGTLQGEGKFITSGVIAVISSFVKIASAVGFVALGLGAHGALLGILVGTSLVIPLVYAAHSSKRLNILNTLRPATTADIRALFLDHTTYRVLIIFFILAILSTFDVIIAKIRLSPDEAGIFAQLSTVAKISYFAFIPLATIGFERFIKNTIRENKFIITYGALVLIAAGLLVVAGPFILNIFFGLTGTQYPSIAGSSLIVAFAAYTITTILVYSLVSRRHLSRSALPLIVVALLTPCVLVLSPASLDGISIGFAACQLALLVAFTFLRYNQYNRSL